LIRLLGYAILAGSFLLKVPEIKKLMDNKSSEGRSLFSSICDILAVLIALAYNFAQSGQVSSACSSLVLFSLLGATLPFQDGSGNPFSTYGENLVILPQNM
jgi:hypothetical protein